MADLSPGLKGPQGERLNLRLLGGDPAQDGTPLPPETSVAIDPQSKRSNALEWESDVDCPTILHELLHLAGLADEYKELSTGYQLVPGGGIAYTEVAASPGLASYRGRKIGPKQSIMSDHNTAVENWKSGKAGSLLMPAHFRAITNPGCRSLNRVYYACTQAAYTSSLETMGTGCDPHLPAVCDSPEAWLK